MIGGPGIFIRAGRMTLASLRIGGCRRRPAPLSGKSLFPTSVLWGAPRGIFSVRAARGGKMISFPYRTSLGKAAAAKKSGNRRADFAGHRYRWR